MNYRTGKELSTAIRKIREKAKGPVGINLIVNKSNLKLKEHLAVCLEEKVDYIITSLGSPALVIQSCKKRGIKVFCDVTGVAFAKKVEQLGADAVIAVNSAAGGHAGPHTAEELIPMLKAACDIPIISAGGVATGAQLKEKLALGADGVSIGSIFIASNEAPSINRL